MVVGFGRKNNFCGVPIFHAFQMAIFRAIWSHCKVPKRKVESMLQSENSQLEFWIALVVLVFPFVDGSVLLKPTVEMVFKILQWNIYHISTDSTGLLREFWTIQPVDMVFGWFFGSCVVMGCLSGQRHIVDGRNLHSVSVNICTWLYTSQVMQDFVVLPSTGCVFSTYWYVASIGNNSSSYDKKGHLNWGKDPKPVSIL